MELGRMYHISRRENVKAESGKVRARKARKNQSQINEKRKCGFESNAQKYWKNIIFFPKN